MAPDQGQIRNPNVEIRNKPEIRNPKKRSQARFTTSARHRATIPVEPTGFGLRNSFGFRPSAFGFLLLLGRYLKRVHHGDIRRVDRVDFQKVNEKEQGGHAFRVIAAYERWFETDSLSAGGEGRGEVESHLGKTCLAILRMLGLFDRPATPDCLVALRDPPIAGLTDALASLNEDDWNKAVAHLVELNLVVEQPWEPRRIVDHSMALRSEMEKGVKE